MFLAQILTPPDPNYPLTAYTIEVNNLPKWQIILMTERAVRDYVYTKNTFAPDFMAYMPGMLKYLKPAMTFTEFDLNFAANNLSSNNEFFGVYDWGDIYWALVEALYDRTFPAITAWHPPVEQGLIITPDQYYGAEHLPSARDTLVYCITIIVKNFRSQYNKEPSMSDIMDGVIRILPASTMFTGDDIAYAPSMLNYLYETSQMFDNQAWYNALVQTLQNRITTPIQPYPIQNTEELPVYTQTPAILTPVETPIVYAQPSIPEIVPTYTPPSIIPTPVETQPVYQQIPAPEITPVFTTSYATPPSPPSGTTEQQTVPVEIPQLTTPTSAETAQTIQEPVPVEKKTSIWIIGGAIAIALYFWKGRKG